jgi:beta-D-xylosidase 4
MASDFVALGFIAGENGPAPYPIKQLVAYERVFDVRGGETKTASLDITLGGLARYDEEGNAVLYPGRYSLLIDVPTATMVTFTLSGAETMLDEWPKRPASG